MHRLVRKGIYLVGKLAARVTSSARELHNELSLIGTMLSERIQQQKTKSTNYRIPFTQSKEPANLMMVEVRRGYFEILTRKSIRELLGT